MNQDIQAYNDKQNEVQKAICNVLAEQIQSSLSGAESKIWHGAPVWFVDDNPLTGYEVLKSGVVKLLFWSGQSFDEGTLHADGKHKAASFSYNSKDDVNVDDLKRWLEKSQKIQWDYKNLAKNKGELKRLI